jgi:glucoamylase
VFSQEGDIPAMETTKSQYRWIEGQGMAFGGPGMPPRWTSSEKWAIGTAYSAASRVWFTISHGILNEIYYPTIDRPQTRDMGLLITDGETFFHEEKRALNFTGEYIDAEALGVRLYGADRKGRYVIEKEIITDPHSPVVLMRVRLRAGEHGSEELLQKLRVYAMLAPHIEGGGMGNSGSVVDLAGKKSLLAWKANEPGSPSIAMIADCGFSRASCGYVGQSDGWQDLHNDFTMNWEFGSALDGNISLTGEIDNRHTLDFRIAIGFGDGHHSAIASAMGALATPFERQMERFIAQWRRAASPQHLAASSCDYGRLMQISHSVLLAHEDKTFAGAFIASASIPWGFAKGDDDLGGYHLVWTRDMVQTASALMACGREETALRALVYLACTQKPDGSFAQNFWVNGTPYWTGLQLDEVAFPIILAWRLWKRQALGTFNVLAFVERAAGFLLLHAPVTQQERWEENAGYSPSTLAAVISGLVCAAELVRAHGADELATLLEEHADWIESHLEDWTVTNNGVLHPDVKRHYMRVRPPECGDPYAHEQCGKEKVTLNNRPPGTPYEFEAREIIDGGFLELVRYGVRRADDPLIVDSLKVVDHVLKVETPRGPCWRRYNFDGYGTGPDGSPFTGYGQGRAWPLLTGERAHYALAAGQDVLPYVQAIEAFASMGGMLPEQIWDSPEIEVRGHKLRPGDPAGSAMPLVWAHAEYLKLLRSLHDRQVFDRIEAVAQRYCGDRPASAKVDVFLLNRAIREMQAGRNLRILADRPFRVLWTSDSWQTHQRMDCRQVGAQVCCADLPVAGLREGQVSFTLFWMGEQRWEGRNFDVAVSAEE